MLGLGQFFRRNAALEKAWAATEVSEHDTVVLMDWAPEDEVETLPAALVAEQRPN